MEIVTEAFSFQGGSGNPWISGEIRSAVEQEPARLAAEEVFTLEDDARKSQTDNEVCTIGSMDQGPRQFFARRLLHLIVTFCNRG